MTNHENDNENTIDETFASQTLGGHDDRTTHGDALQGEAAEPAFDPADYDQADVDQSDVERSDSDLPGAQPDTASGFEDPAAATQGLHDGPVADPVDDADPETTGAG